MTIYTTSNPEAPLPCYKGNMHGCACSLSLLKRPHTLPAPQRHYCPATKLKGMGAVASCDNVTEKTQHAGLLLISDAGYALALF